MPIVINRSRLHSLFRDMVNIYSPSGREEQLVEFLESYLRQAGLPVQTALVEGERRNLLVYRGTETEILFMGHVDTVPAYNIEHYEFAGGEGWCSGLGTADMKSGCAAMIEAFTVAMEKGTLPDRVLLALVVGEEETGDGTNALLNTFQFKDALVAEPTDLTPCLGHYGYVEMIVRAFGYRRHAAMSNRDTNAIRALLRFLLRLEDYVESSTTNSILNIRDLHSSESGFAVPDQCTAAVDFHIPPETSARDYADALHQLADSYMTGTAASGYDIDFQTLADGYKLSVDGEMPRLLRSIFELRCHPWIPQSFQSHSDANLLQAAGCAPVILGPGQLAKAHTADEGVEFEQVARAAEIYADLLERINLTTQKYII